MIKKLVYSKHSPVEHCGVAFFSALLAKHISARHVNSFHGFSRCDEFFINMDIFELEEKDISNLLNFIASGSPRRTVLLMHDYRFSYFEDTLIEACDLVANLSGEPAIEDVARDKMLTLFTPPLTEKPILGFEKRYTRPMSFAFGFFSPRKKSFKKYISFYEYMLSRYPDWYHIIVASSHAGADSVDNQIIARILDSESVLVLDFLPNPMLAELISTANLGVCFYPTGIMANNTAPISFFSQGKTVITTYGELTPDDYKRFALDSSNLDKLDFSDGEALRRLGQVAHKYYEANLTWDVFLERIYARLAEIESYRHS